MRLRVSLVSAMITAGVLAAPAWADPFFFTTGNPDGRLGALSRSESPGKIETETADDFILTETTVIKGATITGLITAPSAITNVEVELYNKFPLDSVIPPSGHVLSRVNSPADVEIDAATRDGQDGTLSFAARQLNASFSVSSTVVNGGDFLYLSAPRSPGVPFVGDLQAWIRNSHLAPDWLRIGTDIIGADPGAAAPTFNMTFSLAGNTVPGAGISGEPNCHGDSISAMANQFGGIHSAASTLGFSSVDALQDSFKEFCKP